jgi:hypothetical protein
VWLIRSDQRSARIINQARILFKTGHRAGERSNTGGAVSVFPWLIGRKMWVGASGRVVLVGILAAWDGHGGFANRCAPSRPVRRNVRR